MTFCFSNICWLWLCAGVIMIIAEFVLPGLVICFFGAGAVIVSLLCAFFPELSLAWQLIIFAVSAVLLIIAVRRIAPGIFKGSAATRNISDIDNDDIVNATAMTVAEITPAVPGKVEFRGTLWDASADESISAGTPVIITARKNLMLFVTKK